jgi:hypothetical protein
MNEEFTYQHIKRFVQQGGNFHALCLKLNCSKRTAHRKIAGYKESGRAFFRHGNHDYKPKSTIPIAMRKKILNLYNQYYFDANFKHFQELLERNHPEIPSISISSLRNIFRQEDVLSPKAWKRTKKALQLKDKTVSPSQLVSIDYPSVSIDPHPRREKSRYTGECVYMDASIHRWFANEKNALHAAIDDASGAVLAAWFEPQETLRGYYQILAQILRTYGIPYLFHTDKRTVFEYKRKGTVALELDASTQFSFACKTLGIDIHTTTCAQAQGKIERLFETLQSRLVVELRLQNVTTIEQANEFLKSYIPIYNKIFAPHFKFIDSTFETQPSEEEINLTLAVISSRIVDFGHCISYNKQHFRFVDDTGKHIPLSPKQKVQVICALDGQLFASCKDRVFALEAVAKHKLRSPVLDAQACMDKGKNIYVPSLIHPWKQGRFESYAINYRQETYSFEELAYTTENFFEIENSFF